jgi:hypothetical protein
MIEKRYFIDCPIRKYVITLNGKSYLTDGIGFSLGY